MKEKILIISFVLVLLAVSIQAAVPPVISYQGKLRQPNGTSIPDDTYSVRFAIYDAPTGGEPLWSETNPSVQVKGGLFAVLLGSVNNLGANILDSQERYLGIKVNEDAELSPRQRIASVATALRAGEADVAKTVLDGAITTDKLADAAVTTGKLGDGAVTADQIADGAVGGTKIANNSVDGDRLRDGAITLAKLASEPWISWTPVYSASAPMTWQGVSTGYARYTKIGKTVIFQLKAGGVTGGTPSALLMASLPFKPSVIYCLNASATAIDGTGIFYPGIAYIDRTTNNVVVMKGNGTNWTLGADREIRVSGMYEIE